MKSKNAILFVTALSSFLTPFMGSAINIALPAIGSEMGMDAIGLGWVMTAYLLSAAVLLLPLGRLSDIYGRKKFFIAGVIIFTLASLFSAVATNSVILIIARAINGSGGAMLYATALALLTSAFPKNERGKVLGINVAAVYLGLSLGPTIGGFMILAGGWRSIFLLTAILSIIILPFALRNIEKEVLNSKPEKFDITGSLIYTLSLAFIVIGFPSITKVNGLIFFTAGVAGFLGFFFIEKKSLNPLLKPEIFKGNQVFVFSNIAAFINYFATYALVFLLSLYLQKVMGLPAHKAGLILMAQPVTMTLLSPVAGKLSDKIEPSIVASLGMAVTVVGLIALSLIDADTQPWFIISMLILMGLGFALFSSPNTNAVMSSVAPVNYGAASSVLGTMRLTGQTFSMGSSMLIFALIMNENGKSLSNASGLLSAISISFIVYALLSVAGVFFSLKRGNLRNKNISNNE